MASQSDNNPGPEVGAKPRAEKEEGWGMGQDPPIANSRRHPCNMIHSEQATWIRWKLIKTIPHFSAFKTSSASLGEGCGRTFYYS